MRIWERLSLIMTLHDIGFNPAEVEHYMNWCWKESKKMQNGLKCWIKFGKRPWMRSIFVKNSFPGWTTSDMR